MPQYLYRLSSECTEVETSEVRLLKKLVNTQLYRVFSTGLVYESYVLEFKRWSGCPQLMRIRLVYWRPGHCCCYCSSVRATCTLCCLSLVCNRKKTVLLVSGLLCTSKPQTEVIDARCSPEVEIAQLPAHTLPP